MLEKIDLTRQLSKSDYEVRMKESLWRLFDLQKRYRRAELAAIVVFEGWDAAGKGTCINRLTAKLEPRGFEVHAIREARTYAKRMPWLWRFWLKLPPYGSFAIFDRSWHGRVLVERVEGYTSKADWRRGYQEINDFERKLADDRYVITKFFLHMTRKMQRQRFELLESDPATAWEVEAEDWHRHEKYDEYLEATEEMLERTDTEFAPWVIVEAADHRWARVKVVETLVARLERGLETRGLAITDSPDASASTGDLGDKKGE